jgi:hypothetical protein
LLFWDELFESGLRGTAFLPDIMSVEYALPSLFRSRILQALAVKSRSGRHEKIAHRAMLPRAWHPVFGDVVSQPKEGFGALKNAAKIRLNFCAISLASSFQGGDARRNMEPCLTCVRYARNAQSRCAPARCAGSPTVSAVTGG